MRCMEGIFWREHAYNPFGTIESNFLCRFFWFLGIGGKRIHTWVYSSHFDRLYFMKFFLFLWIFILLRLIFGESNIQIRVPIGIPNMLSQHCSCFFLFGHAGQLYRKHKEVIAFVQSYNLSLLIKMSTLFIS